jgi:hypothetical protein
MAIGRQRMNGLHVERKYFWKEIEGKEKKQ